MPKKKYHSKYHPKRQTKVKKRKTKSSLKQLETQKFTQAQPVVVKHPKQKNTRFYLSLLGLIAGLLLTFSSLFYLAYRATILSFKTSPVTQVTLASRKELPDNINIQDLNINLPVEMSSIVNGIWEIKKQSANFLDTSARPGEGGNIVIYGHNTNQVFKQLVKIQPAALITLTTQSGTYTYQVKERSIVNPSQIEVVMPTNYEVLTVYTCTGFLDSQRFVVRAYPVGVSFK